MNHPPVPEPFPAQLPTLLPAASAVLQRTQGALTLLREVVQEGSAGYWLKKGLELCGEKKWVEASYAFSRCIQLAPDKPRFYMCRAISKEYLMDYLGALEDCEEAIRLDPNHLQAYHKRAHIKQDNNDYKGAIAEFDRAIAVAPNNSKTSLYYSQRGDAKRVVKDYTGALHDYDRAMELNPSSISSCYSNRAYVKKDQKDYYGAISEYDKAIDLSPKTAWLYAMRGDLHYDLGNYSSALSDYDYAIDLDPTWENSPHGAPYHCRSFVKEALGDMVGAAKDKEIIQTLFHMRSSKKA